MTSEIIFECPEKTCAFSAKKKSMLTEHWRKSTSHYKRFFCDYCSYGSYAQYMVIRHEKVCSENPCLNMEITKLKCQYENCDYETTRKDNLKIHTEKHKFAVYYACQEPCCHYMTLIKKHYDAHTKTHYGKYDSGKYDSGKYGNSIYKCDEEGCSYITNAKQNMRIHERKHSNIRKFKCYYENCDKSYKHKHGLMRHLDNKH